MKAAPADQKRLLDLAEIDSVIDRLAHRRRTLPELAEIDELAARVAKLATQVIAAETEASDLAREQAKAEGDVDSVRTRAERDQKRLDSGQVSSPKDLASLQSEIASLHRRQSDLEEVVLEIMERREAADAQVTKLAAERDELAGSRAAAEDRRDAAFAEIDKERAEAQERRAAVVGGVPGDLLSSTRSSASSSAWPPRCSRAGAASAAARACPSPTSTASRPPPTTRWCAARSAAASWSARRSPVCDVLRRRGRRRVPGNPGPAGYGAVVRDAADGQIIAEDAAAIGTATNNVAEYRGLIAGLRALLDLAGDGAAVEVRMDSKLVVEQMAGRWKIKNEGLRPLALEAGALARRLRVSWRWIPREQNREADRLANEAMDAAAKGIAWHSTTTSGGPGSPASAVPGAGVLRSPSSIRRMFPKYRQRFQGRPRRGPAGGRPRPPPPP
nr:hypothetical protein GCM10020093_042170 [Planobispora longispora]